MDPHPFSKQDQDSLSLKKLDPDPLHLKSWILIRFHLKAGFGSAFT
jgi:hypothetical protein